MTAAQILKKLHKVQKEHDARAHRDIYYLSYPNRMKHLTFHTAKYAGRLAHRETPRNKLEITIVDAFIIALSACDILQIDFAETLVGEDEMREAQDLKSLGVILGKGEVTKDSVLDWYFRQLATIAGSMGKACESLDHMEPVPYREILSGAIIELGRASICAAAFLPLDLVACVRDRWASIEAQKIL